MEKTWVKPSATIVSTNASGFDIAAAAGRLSRSSGSAMEVIDKSKNNPGNDILVGNVLSFGHETIIEHITLTIAFDDVSLAFEQFMIAHRLASFTVKSRRSVNFEDMGYYIPEKLEGNNLAAYKEFMNDMFARYSELIKLGIPLEDARYVLPYSTHSSFICTLNLRELIHILEDVSNYKRRRRSVAAKSGFVTGDGPYDKWDEGNIIRDDIFRQLIELYPGLASYIALRFCKSGFGYVGLGNGVYGEGQYDLKLGVFPAERCGKATLISSWPGKEYDIEPFDEITAVGSALWRGGYTTRFDTRRLEMYGFLARIDDISLAALTHLTRHRMQSLKYGNLPSLMHNRFIIPDSISKSDAAWLIYDEAASEACQAYCDEFVGGANEVYTLLAGSLTFAYVCMNLREFIHFARLRTCNRAQWEIRAIANNMLDATKDTFSIVSHLGPPCAMDGACGEGKMSCGKPYPGLRDSMVMTRYMRKIVYGV